MADRKKPLAGAEKTFDAASRKHTGSPPDRVAGWEPTATPIPYATWHGFSGNVVVEMVRIPLGEPMPALDDMSSFVTWSDGSRVITRVLGLHPRAIAFFDRFDELQEKLGQPKIDRREGLRMAARMLHEG